MNLLPLLRWIGAFLPHRFYLVTTQINTNSGPTIMQAIMAKRPFDFCLAEILAALVSVKSRPAGSVILLSISRIPGYDVAHSAVMLQKTQQGAALAALRPAPEAVR